MPEITGGGPTELKLLAAKLAAADPKLRSELRKKLRQIGTPVRDEVRAAIRESSEADWYAEPATPNTYMRKGVPGRTFHHDPGSLRREIADTIRVSAGSTQRGVRLDIVSLGSRMPVGKQNLNVHSDRRRGWGHPVFERKHLNRPRKAWTWVREWGPDGWFEAAAGRAGRLAQKAAHDALDEVKDFLS